MAGNIIASNFRRINKGTIVGAVDLEIVGWKLMFKGCLYCRKEDRQWIQFPRQEYNDREGNRKYADIISFSDKEVSKRFQKAALAAVREIA